MKQLDIKTKNIQMFLTDIYNLDLCNIHLFIIEDIVSLYCIPYYFLV